RMTADISADVVDVRKTSMDILCAPLSPAVRPGTSFALCLAVSKKFGSWFSELPLANRRWSDASVFRFFDPRHPTGRRSARPLCAVVGFARHRALGAR